MTNLNSQIITSHSSWNPTIPFERKKNQNLSDKPSAQASLGTYVYF